MPKGTNVVTVQAQNSAGTVNNQKVQIVTSGGTTPKALVYDKNGNTTTDESGNTYTWDALNRLITIKYSSGATSNFAYDGSSRRISIIEKNSSGTVTSTKLYVWVGNCMAEERNATNVVQKRFYGQGEQQSGTAYFYTRDHLGSVRELISSIGAITSRLSYDVYGRTTVVSGTTLPTPQYAGYYNHMTSGLYLTLNRIYDSNTGRWLSRDPIGESGDSDLYGYCGDAPTLNRDPLGLIPTKPTRASGVAQFTKLLAGEMKKLCDCKCVPLERRGQCEADADKISDAIIRAWYVNYKDNENGGDLIGGYYCWDWAADFVDDAKAAVPSTSIWKAILIEWTDPAGVTADGIPVHFSAALVINGGGRGCFLNIDDGFFDGNHVHPSSPKWPSPGSGYGRLASPNLNNLRRAPKNKEMT